jgi:hypothetical protein
MEEFCIERTRKGTRYLQRFNKELVIFKSEGVGNEKE